MPELTTLGRANKLLWRIYRAQDAFIRQRQFSWSAEVVVPQQAGPPYRTEIIAETSTLDALIAQLEDRA